jgi:hypothetical protein
MNEPLDKNGIQIKAGDTVVPLATLEHYQDQRRVPVTEKDGELWVGHVRLSEFRNGTTDYHAVTIVQ